MKAEIRLIAAPEGSRPGWVNRDRLRCGLAAPLILILAGRCTWTRAQDWPQWRGLNRDGVARGAKLPATWPERLEVTWRAPAGPGYSTPVVAEDHVYFMERARENEVVRALDARDGSEIWRYAYAVPYEAHPYAGRHGNWPKSTTTVADGKVYSFGISGVLCALNAATGRLEWKRDLGAEFKSTPTFGAAASPLVVAGLVVLPVGHKDGGGGLMAFRADSGKTAWTAIRDGPSYSSPIVCDLAGVRQIVSFTAKHLVGVALADGKELWSYPFELPWDETIVTPLVWKDLVLFAGRNMGGTRALRPRREGDKVVAEEVWTQKAPVYMSSPVIADGALFAVEHRTGRLFCLQLSDGSLAWKEGAFGDYASLVLVGKRILLLDSKGTLTVIAARKDRYQEIAVRRVAKSPTYAHLVVCGSRLYVRDRKEIRAIDLAGRTTAETAGDPSD